MGTLIGIISLICAIWVIYDVLVKNTTSTIGIKIVWIICAIFFSIITAIAYYFVHKKK